jgi:hypothetical protein
LDYYGCIIGIIRANGDAADPNPVLPDIEIKQNPTT